GVSGSSGFPAPPGASGSSGFLVPAGASGSPGFLRSPPALDGRPDSPPRPALDGRPDSSVPAGSSVPRPVRGGITVEAKYLPQRNSEPRHAEPMQGTGGEIIGSQKNPAQSAAIRQAGGTDRFGKRFQSQPQTVILVDIARKGAI